MKKIAILLLGILIASPAFAMEKEFTPDIGDTEEGTPALNNLSESGQKKLINLVNKLIEKQKNESDLTLNPVDKDTTEVTIKTEDSTKTVIVKNSKLKKYFINALIMYGILLGTDALGYLVAKLTEFEDIEFNVYKNYIYAPGDLNIITINAIILGWEWLAQNVPVFLFFLKGMVIEGLSNSKDKLNTKINSFCANRKL